jgi:hypothetical protein
MRAAQFSAKLFGLFHLQRAANLDMVYSCTIIWWPMLSCILCPSIAVVLILLALTTCMPERKTSPTLSALPIPRATLQGDTPMYTFKAIHKPDAIAGTSKLVNYPQNLGTTIPFEQYGTYIAQFRGTLLQLFGEPFTTEGDAVFEYILEAADHEGKKWILTAYEGASGPAIGGNARDSTAFNVAASLLDLIEQTTPADFKVTHYNDEYNSTITYGCKGGSCYYHEEQGTE